MTEPISEPQRQALALLAPELPQEAYLAGGVAVALRRRHRASHDLDLFLPSQDPLEQVETLAQEKRIQMTSRAPGTVYLRVDQVPVSLIRYRYPLLRAPERIQGIPIRVASLNDLLCMKLSAIANRGALRDFWDLHEMFGASMSLDEALRLYGAKYSREDSGHVLRSLVYFADADAEPLPPPLTPAQWAAIKESFRARVKEWVGS